MPLGCPGAKGIETMALRSPWFLLALTWGLPVAAPCQDALRAWSPVTFDTDAYRLPVLQVESQWYNTAVLRADGRIYVHGSESGFGGICRPPLPPPGQRFTSVAISGSDGLGLLSDGTLMHWTNHNQNLPAPPPLPAGVGYTQVSIGAVHALALRSDGQLVGWHKTLGGGAPLSAVPTFPAGTSVRSFRACYLNSMVLLSDGTIQGWGYNTEGELNIPTLPPNTVYTHLWSGMNHFVARRSDGVFVSWGMSFAGQTTLPALPPGVTFVDFAIGGYHTAALRSDGVLVAWGDNSGHQCDVTPLPPGSVVAQMSAGEFCTLVRLTDGRVLGWGGPFGELPPTLPAAQQRFVDVAMGYGPAIGLTSDGLVVPSGVNEPWLQTPPPVPPGMHYTSVHMGWRHAAAFRSDGQLIMWGENPNGLATVPLLPVGTRYTQVALGSNHTVALRSDGVAVHFGALNQVRTPPVGTTYVQVDAEATAFTLLRSDGGILSQHSPVPALPPDLTYVEVSCGQTHSAALRSDGQVVVWPQGSWMVQALPPGVVYVDIESGGTNLAARRSDGEVVVTLTGQSSGQEVVPPLQAGESYYQLSAKSTFTAARVGPTTRYVSFAPGCAGTRPATRLIPRNTPHIGKTHQVRLFDLPQHCAVMVLGWSRVPPVSLTPLGMPGCQGEVSLDAALFVAGQNHQAVYQLPIPDWTGLVGLHFYNQAVVLDPGANALGAVVSEAAEGVIGHR